MRLVVSLTIDGEPVPKARPRFGAGRRVYTPTKTKKAEAAIGRQIKSVLRDTEPDGASDFGVEIVFHCALAGTDLDNLTKLALDACNKLVWRDDRQVTRLAASLIRKSKEPRTVLKIYALG